MINIEKYRERGYFLLKVKSLKLKTNIKYINFFLSFNYFVIQKKGVKIFKNKINSYVFFYDVDLGLIKNKLSRLINIGRPLSRVGVYIRVRF